MISQFIQVWQTASQSEKKEIANFVAKEMQPKTIGDAKKILEYLNSRLGTKYRPVAANTSLIQARLAEGYTVDEIVAVVARMCSQWEGSSTMAQYLRPKTLFNATNFNNYVGQLDMKQPEPEKPKLKRPPMNDNAAWIELAKKVGAGQAATYDQIWSMATVAYDNGQLAQ